MTAETGSANTPLTGSANTALTIVDGVEVWPCRCGETHGGQYGWEDWLQHQCFHRTPLLVLSARHALCDDCGQTFRLDAHPADPPRGG